MQYAKDNFTINNGDIYLRSKLNDTIYKVHEDYSTERYLYFKMGSLKSPSLLVPGEEWEAKYLTLSDIALTDNHVYLTFAGRPRVPRPDVFGIEYLVYDKGSGNYYFLDDHPNLYAGEDNTTSAPINNLDGLDQTSEFIYHIRNDITWDVLEIVNAKEYLESDDFDPSKLSTDKYYKKVKKLLEESDIEDNPIIRICFLK